MNGYQLALLLTRLLGIMNLAIGIAWLMGVVGVFFLTDASPQKYLDTALSWLMYYSLGDLVSGIILLVFSRRIARFAAKHSDSILGSSSS
jgi:hypothetical protein